MARILITSGPTRQYLDPVRYLTNSSSGRMGSALAILSGTLGFGGGAGRRQPWQQLPRVGRRGVARGDEDSDDGTAHGGAVAALCEARHAAEAGAAHTARRVACRQQRVD